MLAVPTSRGLSYQPGGAQVGHEFSQGRGAMHAEQQIRPGRSFFRGSSFFGAKPALVAAMWIAAALFCFIGVRQSSGNSGKRAVPAQDHHRTGVSRAAIDKFWTFYRAHDYAAIPEDQERLQQ